MTHDQSPTKLSTLFIPIATSGGVTLCAPDHSYISFTNSPYYAHQHALAVDIYHPSGQTTAFSPVQGNLVDVFPVRSPHSSYFRAEEEERLLVIQPADNPDVVVRVLHTDWNPDLPQTLEVGAVIGRIVRSGFYDFWTDPHIHVEVRKPTHVLRAKGSLPIVPLTHRSRLLGTLSEISPALRIVKVNENYTLVEPIEDLSMSVGPLQGFACRAGKALGILDAGVPHYRVGSVLLEEDGAVNPGDYVTLWGTLIGKVVACHHGLALFTAQPLVVRLDDHVIRGLAIYPWVGRRPLLKLIPQRPSRPSWSEGDVVMIHW